VTEADHSCKFTCICTVFELYMLAYIFPLENRNRRDTKFVGCHVYKSSVCTANSPQFDDYLLNFL